jgi:hypothetical protein
MQSFVRKFSLINIYDLFNYQFPSGLVLTSFGLKDLVIDISFYFYSIFSGVENTLFFSILSKLQEKPSTLKGEHPALQNMKILYFFYFVGHSKGGSGTQINADPQTLFFDIIFSLDRPAGPVVSSLGRILVWLWD